MAKLSRNETKFWRAEMELCNTLHTERQKEWQKLIDMFDLKFSSKMRDLGIKDIVPVSILYPIVRQVIASIAFSNPRLWFAVEDDDADGTEVSSILERAAASWINLTDVKSHCHQIIFDALFCGCGWGRLDYNPPGNDMIPPYVANDAMAEDLVTICRVPPQFVKIDPKTSPHMLDGRYIIEDMWVPLRFLKDDPTIDSSAKNKLSKTKVGKENDIGFGEVDQGGGTETPEQIAYRESIENGEYVFLHRIHDRWDKKLITFADGLDEAVSVQDHPWRKIDYPQRLDLLNQPMYELDPMTGELTDTPMLDLENGQDGVGWLVENGFGFIPIKFDLTGSSFWPKPQMKYLEPMQNGVVESMSRKAASLKRQARQGLVRRSEAESNTQLVPSLQRGQDGEYQIVEDPDSAVRQLDYMSIPGDQDYYEQSLMFYAQQIASVNELGEGGGSAGRTATEAALIGAAAASNRTWMEEPVENFFSNSVRNAFQIMASPIYQPESFTINVAPEGHQRVSRALRNADFLWTYRISVQAGSMQPLFEQLQQEKALDFFSRGYGLPELDNVEMVKMLVSSFDIIDPQKVLRDDQNVEAQQAARLETEMMMSQQTDPGVYPGQDHQAHMEIHSQYQEHPRYIEMMQREQQFSASAAAMQQGGAFPQMQQPPGGDQSAAMRQQIDQLINTHIQTHQQQMQQEEDYVGAPPSSDAGGIADTLQGVVASNAQRTSNRMQADVQETIDAL